MASRDASVMFTCTSLADARRAIARALLPDLIPSRIGGITLEPHQVDAARRLRTILRNHGGALLADDVGLGKTFVALAVATAYANVVVIHPAALGALWRDALARTGVAARCMSYEALSRGATLAPDARLVILDEAHHARSPTARRHAAIAALTAHADVLLLSATPLPNHTGDLRALFALFLGDRAASLDPESMRALTVRRTSGSAPHAALPPVAAARWVEVPGDGATLDLLLALPPPVPARDEGESSVLVRLGLVRRWASSRGALRESLRRRLARASALDHALRHGRRPTRAELAAWTCVGDSLQLALPELVADDGSGTAGSEDPAEHDSVAWARALAAHSGALVELLAHLRRTPDPDAARVESLLRLRAAHAGERVIAFTEYADTVDAYWRHIRTIAGVARLTARGGEIASGRLAREEVLWRFAPAGQRRAPPRSIEAVTLLVTTDLLAEGVDLRDATVVVHLDLPWSPTRMEQRVGRARRLGSAASRITVLAMRPPARAEAFLALEGRLNAKRSLADQLVGTADGVLPPCIVEGRRDTKPSAGSDAEQLSAALDRVASWLDVPSARNPAVDSAATPDHTVPRDSAAIRGHATRVDELAEAPRLAIARCEREGWLALVSVGGVSQLVACIDGGPSNAPAVLRAAIDVAGTAHDAVDRPGDRVEPLARRALDAAARWANERLADELLGGSTPPPGSVMHRVIARLDRSAARAPAEDRAAAASGLARVRTLATRPHAAGLEHSILEALTAEADDRVLVERLAAIMATAECASSDAPGSPHGAHRAGVRILLLFQPDAAFPDAPATPSSPRPGPATPS